MYMPVKKSAKKPASKSKAAPKPKAAAKLKAKAATKEPKKQKFFRTGEKCPESGLYSHFCSGKGEKSTIPLSKTETFPPCRACGSVKWTLVMAA
jgi:hypothetical protein